MADACIFLMNLDDDEFFSLTRNESIPPLVNVGFGVDLTIRELAKTIQDVVGYDGDIIFDTTKPDGTPRKLLDVSRLHNKGWNASTHLREGLSQTYNEFFSRLKG